MVTEAQLDDTIEKFTVKQITDEIPHDFIKFNKLIGLPKHPQTMRERPLTSIQKTFYKTYIHEKRQDKIHLNKARQCGWTELMLRVLAYHAFFKYAGKKIIIIPGTRESTTKEIYGRFKELFRNISNQVAYSGALYMRLKNGTEIYGQPAAPEAITGWTKIGCVFMDEAAKWNLTEDLPVINAILPIVRTNKSDVIMISTPKGPRGFFYNIEMNQESSFAKPIYDIHAGGQELYTDEERMEMINSSEEDPNQEYLNQYVAGRDSIFGKIDDEDIESGDLWE